MSVLKSSTEAPSSSKYLKPQDVLMHTTGPVNSVPFFNICFKPAKDVAAVFYCLTKKDERSIFTGWLDEKRLVGVRAVDLKSLRKDG